MKILPIKSAGYSLVEVMVAVSVLLLSIVGPMTIAAKGIQTGRFVGEQTTATYLAQEGIEAVVALRNQEALEFYIGGSSNEPWDWVGNGSPSTKPASACFIPSGNGCNIEWQGSAIVVTQCTNASSCLLRYATASTTERSRYTTVSAGTPSPYTRVIRLEENGAGEVEVRSSVTWNTNLFGGTRTVELRSSVFDIYGE
jgi:Tfp pilus assembly protein PilV